MKVDQPLPFPSLSPPLPFPTTVPPLQPFIFLDNHWLPAFYIAWSTIGRPSSLLYSLINYWTPLPAFYIPWSTIGRTLKRSVYGTPCGEERMVWINLINSCFQIQGITQMRCDFSDDPKFSNQVNLNGFWSLPNV